MTSSAMPRTCAGIRYWFITGMRRMKNAAAVSKMPANNTMLQIQSMSASGKKCKIHILIFIEAAIGHVYWLANNPYALRVVQCCVEISMRSTSKLHQTNQNLNHSNHTADH